MGNCPFAPSQLASDQSCHFTCDSGYTPAGDATSCMTGKLFSQSCVPLSYPTYTPPTGENFDATVPAYLQVLDFSNEASPLNRGRIYFDTRASDIVFDHVWLKTSIGAISMVNTAKTVVWGEFEFGAVLLAHAPTLNAQGSNPVYQVLVGGKPFGRWATYPARRTFNKTTDVTHPPPFKVEIYSASNQLLGKIEMQDGLPINSPKLTFNRDTENPARPLWHIGQLLKWQNAMMKSNVNMKKWIGGFTPDSIRPSQAKGHASVNPALGPLGYGADMRTQWNGLNQWYALPKWPLPWIDDRWSYGNMTLEPNNDPYLFNPSTTYPQHLTSWTGFGYEPGSIGGHDHLTGPGGQRCERAPIATPYAIYYVNASWIKLKDGTPIRELVEDWGNNYFNHGGYWIRDLTKFTSLPMDEVHRNRWSFLSAYYGSQLSEIPTGDPLSQDYDVQLLVAAQGAFDPYPSAVNARNYYYDRDGKPFWNGWGVDQHHSYQFSGWHTLMFSSGAHLFAARQGYTWNKMSWLGDNQMHKDPGIFMYRTMAFRWHHMVMQWILANPHPQWGVNATAIEEQFHNDLATIVDVLKWGSDNAALFGQAAYPNVTLNDVTMSRFGIYCGVDYNGNQQRLVSGGSSLTYYATYMWAMMRTSGMWDKLRLNPKSKIGLDWTLSRFDKFALDKAVYARNLLDWGGGGPLTPWVQISISRPWSANDIPTNWSDWLTKVAKPTGNETWIFNTDGSIRDGRGEYAASHIEVAYAFMRRDYYPDVPYDTLQQACTLHQKAYDAVTSLVASQPSPSQQQGYDWYYRWPSLGFLTPPQCIPGSVTFDKCASN